MPSVSRPLFRALCFAPSVSRPLFRALVSDKLSVLLAFFALLTLLSNASAQTSVTQAYAGNTLNLGATTTTTGSFDAPPSWRIYGPNGLVATTATPNGLTVSQSSNTLRVGIPANAAPANYTVQYCTSVTSVFNKTTQDYTYTYHLLVAGFTVVATPPTLPPAGMPAFSWQGTVGGVNTGNGNKTTVLPIVGWTQRGGMGVACTLYHNSEGSIGGTYGNKWNPSYLSYFSQDASGNLTIHWDNGLVYLFTKNPNGGYIPPVGILDTLTLRYGTSGYPILTTTNNTVYTFSFVPASGQSGYGNAYLASVADMDGNTLTISHNTDTTLNTVTDATGRALTYAYAGGKLFTVTDPLLPTGRVWTFNYGTAGGNSVNNLYYVTLPSLNDGMTHSLYFGYDSNFDITLQQSVQGTAATFGYNANGVLAWAKDAVGNKTTFTYNASSTVITDPNGHPTTHTYTYSRLSSVTDALGYHSDSNYDLANILSSTTDRRGNVWGYSSHFTNGSNVSTATEPPCADNIVRSTSTTYDAKNKVTQSIDGVGNTASNTYSPDSYEDLLTTSVTGTGSSPFQANSRISGYANGLPTTFMTPLDYANGYSSSVTYDSNGYVNGTTDQNKHSTSAVFNALGWQTSSADANKNGSTPTYDNWGRVTDIMAMDGTHTKMTYDYDGDVLTVQDANLHTTYNTYDADDRLTQTKNGRGDVVKYTYDGPNGYGSVDRNGVTQYGLLSSKTDGNGHVTTYAYTARNEPFQTVYADGTSENCSYDANGNVIGRTNPNGVSITYAYDAGNRLTDITYPHLHATHFNYDADGRKTLMTDATGTTSWYYGADGVHLAQLASPQGTITYQYDGDGRQSEKYANVTNVGVVSYWYTGYDPAGLLHSVRSTLDGTTTYAYDNADRLLTQTNANGDVSTYGYDTTNEITDITHATSAGVKKTWMHYGYDLAGNVHSEDYNSGNTTTYGYDGADQLTGEVQTVDGGGPTNYSEGYTYDNNGNRLTHTVNGSQVQNFTYDGHDKVATAANETDHYDLAGNQTSVLLNGGTSTRVFDDEDRLTSITVPGVGTDSFIYNGLGLRVGKADSTGTFSFLCDGASPGSPVLWDGYAVYTPGLSENRGGTTLYNHGDLLGSLVELTNSSQQPTNAAEYDGFGSITSSWLGQNQVPSVTPFKFVGGSGCQTDADTGLVLMGHRYYDSRQGRFISQDPAGSGDNWYAYAGNDPVDNTDPTGLMIAGSGWGWDPDHANDPYNGDATQQFNDGDPGTYNQFKNGKYSGTQTIGGLWDRANNSAMGPGFMNMALSPPMESRKNDNLAALLAGLAALLGALHGGVKGNPTVHNIPNTVPVKAKKGPTVEEKDKAKNDFSLQNFEQNMGRLGSETRDFLDDLAAAEKRQQSSSYAPVIFGGGGGVYEYF